MTLVFAYGSAMHPGALARYLDAHGCAERPTSTDLAQLRGWCLDWHHYSVPEKGARASIAEQAGGLVHGVVLAVGPELLRHLDGQHGDAYERIAVRVVLGACRVEEAWTYRVLAEHRQLRRQLPTRTYRALMVEGAAAAGAPSGYLLHLQSLPVCETFWAQGIHFQCQQSGKCCTARADYGFVYLGAAERAQLASFLGLSVAELRVQYLARTDGHWHLKHPTRDCVFLHERRCSVYEARPSQCRTWPFWPENLRTEAAWQQEVASFCPGVGKGEQVPAEEIYRVASEKASC